MFDPDQNDLNALEERLRSWVPSTGGLDRRRIHPNCNPPDLQTPRAQATSRTTATRRGKGSLGLLLAASCALGAVTAYSHAQYTLCYAGNISEALSNMTLTWVSPPGVYFFNYDVTVKWDCSGGQVSAYCIVCEVDYLYQLVNGQYNVVSAVGTQDSGPSCSTRGNTDKWSGTFTGLAPNQQWEIVAAYKPYAQNSPCNSPSGFQTGAFKYFYTY
ncbi:MAG: hypothetical protein ACP5XB_09420 [Isosphaeraceae bacterium]